MALRKIKSILDDPRYEAFVERYRYNWDLFSLELVEKEPTYQQVDIIESTQEVGSLTTVSSGHGTGKSDMTATMFLAFITTLPLSRGVLTANNLRQTKIGVFKYMKENWGRILKNAPWLGQYFTLTESVFYANEAKGQWEMLSKSCRQGQEEALAGEHAEHMLIVVDEASGVSDKAFGVLTGALTQEDNRFLLLSQPTRPAGFFYDTHHKLAYPRGRWNSIVLNSEESPLVTMQFIIDKRVEYGGREATEYLIKVRGQFPDIVDGMLLGRAPLDKAATLDLLMPDGWGWIATIDVGNGRDKSVINICQVWGDRQERIVKSHRMLEMPSTVDPVRFADYINAECDEERYPNISLVVDGDGIGAATIAALDKLGRNAQSIRWGKPCFSKSDRARFKNKRAMASVLTRDAVMDGRMQIDKDVRTAEQGSKIPCALNELGQWVIMKKEVMRQKLNIKSPDRFDTYCFTMLADFTPVGDIVINEAKEARSDIEDMVLSDVADVLDELS
jgi:fermentation-respiration switch protein FrsA (DUF1100 family)